MFGLGNPCLTEGTLPGHSVLGSCAQKINIATVDLHFSDVCVSVRVTVGSFKDPVCCRGEFLAHTREEEIPDSCLVFSLKILTLVAKYPR